MSARTQLTAAADSKNVNSLRPRRNIFIIAQKFSPDNPSFDKLCEKIRHLDLTEQLVANAACCPLPGKYLLMQAWQLLAGRIAQIKNGLPAKPEDRFYHGIFYNDCSSYL